MARLAFSVLLALALSLGRLAFAAPPIEAYGKLPGVENVKISPSGQRLAFIAAVGDDRKLLVTTADSKPLTSANVGAAKVRALEWAGEKYLLVTLTATVNIGLDFRVPVQELETVVVINADTGKDIQVFGAAHADKVANIVVGRYGSAQIDGRWYGFFAGITLSSGKAGSHLSQGYPDLYRVDLETGAINIAAYGQNDIDGWLVNSAGEVVARSFYGNRTSVWSVMTGRNGGTPLAGGHADFAGSGSMHLGRTPDTMLTELPDQSPDAPPEGHRFRELSLSGAAEKGLPAESVDFRPLFDPVTHLWIGNRLLDDQQNMEFFTPAMQARWRGTQKAFPKNIVHLESWSADFNRLVVLTEGGDDSGTFWLVDIAQHSADPLGEMYPDVKAPDVGPVSTVDWHAADGMPLHGVLTLPPGKPTKSLPLVVLPHGGPAARDFPGFDWWAQAFASRGYAVFQPNFRGSGGFGVAFRDAGFGQWGRKMQTDVSDGVADLAKKGIIDPKRACIVGASYGGYAALAGVTIQHGLYRCAVAVAGVSDLREMLRDQGRLTGTTNPSTRYWKTFIGVTSSEDSSTLDPLSPSEQAAQADAPILLIHGKDDTVVPMDQSETMRSALERAGKPVELVKMDNEDHWLSRQDTRVQMLTAAVAFVEKHNPAN
jgi:dipeptidyl aminopeptidase/acylaminoacyl peptidase